MLCSLKSWLACHGIGVENSDWLEALKTLEIKFQSENFTNSLNEMHASAIFL